LAKAQSDIAKTRRNARSLSSGAHSRDPLAIAPDGLPLSRNWRNCYIADMTTAEDIEKAVEQLAPRELARFRAWFEAFDAEQFDAAIERDISAGKLDAHAEEALAAHREN
jgi:hypothetical protein